MAFDNVQFPDDIGYGSQAGPGFKTNIIELAGGAEERVSRWSQPRHQYNISYGIRTYDDLYTVKRFFMARRGALQSFLFKDWQDYATNVTGKTYQFTDAALDGSDQPLDPASGATLGQGDGTEKVFQMVKEYPDDILDFQRVITKPLQGTILVKVNGSLQTESTHYTVNYQTGVVTFVTAPTAGHTVTWGGEFNVPVRFDESTDEWLSMSFDDFSSGSLPAVRLIEDIDSTAVPERFWMGGVKNHGDQTGTTVPINLVDGRVHRISPQNTTVVAELQRADDIAPGGPVFYIQNAGSQPMAIKTTDGTTVVASLAVSNIAVVLISDDGVGGKTYIAAT